MRFFLLSFLAGTLHAQIFGFGVKGGLRLTEDLRGSVTSESKRYVIGTMSIFRLPLGFSIENNVLYRRLGLRVNPDEVGVTLPVQSFRAHSVEVAFVGRKSIWKGVYAGAGYAPRVIFSTGGTQSGVEVPAFALVTHGAIGSVGIERRFGPILIAPELRCMHWSQPSVQLSSLRGFAVQPARNELDFLVGIGF